MIERQEAILALLDRTDNGLALREIDAKLRPDTSGRQVRRALTGLRDSGLVASTGPGPAARWKRVGHKGVRLSLDPVATNGERT